MLTELQIKNVALAKIGDYIISALGEGSKQDTYANIYWQQIVDALLEEFPWNFAIKRSGTTLITAVLEPRWGYDHKYEAPTDCIRVLEIAAGTTPITTTLSGTSAAEPDWSNTIEYRVEGAGATPYIVTNEDAPVYIKYICRPTGTTFWPPSFRDAVACKLALLLGKPLAQISESEKQMLAEEYENAIAKGRGVDFEEGQNEQKGYYSMTYCRDN